MILRRFPLILGLLFTECFSLSAQTIAWRLTDGNSTQGFPGNLVPMFIQETDNPPFRLIKIDAPTATSANVSVSPNSSVAGNWLRFARVNSNTDCSSSSVVYNTFPASFSANTPIYICLSGPRNSNNVNTLKRGYYGTFLNVIPPGRNPLVIPIRLDVSPNGYLQLSSTCDPKPNCTNTINGDRNDFTFNFNVNNSVADPAQSVYAVVVAPDNPTADPNGTANVQLRKALSITPFDNSNQRAAWVTVSALDPGTQSPQASPTSSALVRIGIDPRQLPSDQTDLSARVQINSGGVFQGEGNIYITAHVTAPPATLSVGTTSINFSYPNGSVSELVSPQSSGATITYTATATSNDGTGWLTVTPDGDTQSSITVAATVTPARAQGTYTGSVAITPSSVSGSPIVIPVTLRVSAAVFQISGTVSDPSGACSAGVTMGLTGPGSASTTTGANGNYSFVNLVATRYTVTPFKTGCTFNPPSLVVNLTADSFNNNFTTGRVPFTLLYPLNGATDILPTSTLTWSAVPGATSYDVYFGVGTPQFAANVTANAWPIVGATANVTYSWRVVAKSAANVLSTSDTWMFTTGSPPSASGLYFIPVTPCHLVDTRASQGISGPLGPPTLNGDETRTFYPPLGACPGISPSAKAYSFTVTARPTNILSFLTIWPAGQNRPGVSTLNAFLGGTVSNSAIVPAGDGGGVSVYVTHQSDVALDVNGYFDSVASSGATTFYTLPPCRIADTRNPNGVFGGPRLPGGSTRDFPLATSGCIPPQTGATGFSLNVTVVPLEPLDNVVTWASSTPQPPSVITLGSPSAAILADATIVQAGPANGSVSVYASNQTHVLLDINGYFRAPGPGGLLFHPTPPCRIVDTRLAPGLLGGPIMAGNEQRTIPVGVSPCAIPKGARAYSLNVTVVPSSVLSFLTLLPTGQSFPTVSTLNDFAGIILANAAVVPVGQNDSIDVYVTHSSHVILDINGYFSDQK